MKKTLISVVLGSVLALNSALAIDFNAIKNSELTKSLGKMAVENLLGDKYKSFVSFLDSSNYDQNAFQSILASIKNSGISIENLLLSNYGGDSIISKIVKNDLVGQASDIISVFGPLKDSSKIEKSLEGVSISDKMKSILF